MHWEGRLEPRTLTGIDADGLDADARNLRSLGQPQRAVSSESRSVRTAIELVEELLSVIFPSVPAGAYEDPTIIREFTILLLPRFDVGDSDEVIRVLRGFRREVEDDGGPD